MLKKMLEEDKSAGLIPFYVIQYKFDRLQSPIQLIHMETGTHSNISDIKHCHFFYFIASHTSVTGLLLLPTHSETVTQPPTELTATTLFFTPEASADNIVSVDPDPCLSG